MNPKTAILVGDVRDMLRTLPEQSVHCCVTSPPYFALRDYGVDGQIGLESTPEEYIAVMVDVFREVRRVLRNDGTLWLNIGDSYSSFRDAKAVPDTLRAGSNGTAVSVANNRNGKLLASCGLKHKDLIGIPWQLAFALRQPYEHAVIRSQIDRAWLAALVDGEGCITTVCADGSVKDGRAKNESYAIVLQVRMCDRECMDRAVEITGMSHVQQETHAPSQVAAGQRPSSQWKISGENAASILAEIYPYLLVKRRQALLAWNLQRLKDGVETKRGVPIPAANMERRRELHRLIRAANQRQPIDVPEWCNEPKIPITPGWYLRSEIVWAKPNPMPESVNDRPTKSHEQIFLLTKSARYFYDQEAVREGYAEGTAERYEHGFVAQSGKTLEADGMCAISVKQTLQNDGQERFRIGSGRNLRSVWTIATEPYSEAHFATFPRAIPEKCIKAGTSEKGCCATCGATWERVIEKQRRATRPGEKTKVEVTNSRFHISRDPNHLTELNGKERLDGLTTGNRDPQRHVTETITTGWEPGCDCGAECVPCTVLDPFGGSCTTLVVAKALGRNGIACELNPEYAEMAKRRIARGYDAPPKQEVLAGQKALFD